MLVTRASASAPRSNADVFDTIYKHRGWGGDGVDASLSGSGSSDSGALTVTNTSEKSWSEAPRGVDFVDMLKDLTAVHTIPLDAKAVATVLRSDKDGKTRCRPMQTPTGRLNDSQRASSGVVYIDRPRAKGVQGAQPSRVGDAIVHSDGG